MGGAGLPQYFMIGSDVYLGRTTISTKKNTTVTAVRIQLNDWLR